MAKAGNERPHVFLCKPYNLEELRLAVGRGFFPEGREPGPTGKTGRD